MKRLREIAKDILRDIDIIGHMKSDYRMARNFLKGFAGDEINLLLAASPFNLKKWMNIYFLCSFFKKYHSIH